MASHDPSVRDEPHLCGKRFEPDPSETRAAHTLRRERARRGATDDQRIEHTVWDEPGLSSELAGPVPEGVLKYRDWLLKRRDEVSSFRSWATTIGLALVAGPWALLGGLWGWRQTGLGVVAAVVFAPVVEEMMKVAAALYVVEKRPFLFRGPVQIIVCVLAVAFTFAAVENLLYVGLYGLASPSLVRWRWTVCVAMHMAASCIAGLGLVRVWQDVWERRDRARLRLAFPYLLGAIALHGSYNAFVVLLASAGYGF